MLPKSNFILGISHMGQLQGRTVNMLDMFLIYDEFLSSPIFD